MEQKDEKQDFSNWKAISLELGIIVEKMVNEYVIYTYPVAINVLYRVYEKLDGTFSVTSNIKIYDKQSSSYLFPCGAGQTEVSAIKDVLIKIAGIILRFECEADIDNLVHYCDDYEY